MSKTRNISDLLDANGDVKSGALDNVPASDDASALSTGTLPDGRFPATLPAASGVNLTALNASNLGSGTVPDARFPATLPAANGSALTALNASNVASGTLADARLSSNITTNDGTQTLTNKTIAASQLTGALPALDGSALTNLSGGVSDVDIVVVTSSGTYTPTSGTKFVTVYCIGAGGGGGNTSGSSNKPCVGGGGGGGGMAIRTYNATELGANASISIGSGGSGGASHHDPRDGSNGNGTTFNPAGTGTTLTGNGGTGGYGASNQYWGRGGTGGAASNGQINMDGMPAYVISNHSHEESYSRSSQGNSGGVTGMAGGFSMFTRGSLNTAYGGSGNIEVGGASGAVGCGGQGAMARQNYGSAGAGGSGGSGYVVIMEYA